MAIPFHKSIDLLKNELLNVRLQNLGTAPVSPAEGQIYYSTSQKDLFVWTGSAWKSYADASGAMFIHGNDYHDVNYEDSANKENATIDTSITKYPTVNLLKTGLDGKVNVVAGMSLSQESFTTTEKTKLSGIAAGAQVNVATNIAQGTRTTTTVPITSSTGTGATLTAATTSLAGVMISADKTKLDGIANGANLYVHPDNHPPSIIAQDANSRFVTDAEKTTWNGKSDLVLGTTSVTAFRGDHGHAAHTHSGLVTGNPHAVTKANVGLANVEDKSSATIRNEITSANITTPLGFTPENAANKGAANGYAGLDAHTKIPLAQLPDASKQQTYVVLNATARNALTGLLSGDKAFETSTGNSYIWNGTTWVTMAQADWENVNIDYGNIVNPPTLLALGATSTTAYRGDHGLAAYNHSLSSHAPSNAQRNADITKAEIEARLTGVITTHTHEATTLKHAQNIGNAVDTGFVVTHAMNTRDVAVTVREAAAPFQVVFTDVEMTSLNTVTVSFSQPPALNEFRVIVVG